MEKFNKHHKLPKSRGWTADKSNIKIRDMKEHSNRHAVYWNDTPVEQIIKVLTVNKGVRTKWFEDAIIEVLLNYDGEYYKERCMNKDPRDDLSPIDE